MSKHKHVITEAVLQLEAIVHDLERELRRREADLKVMKLMLAQCEKEEK